MPRKKKDDAEPVFRGRPLSLPGPIGSLAREMGGRDKMAAATGVDEKTIYRWAHDGRVGSNPLKILLADLFKKHGVTDGVEAFLNASGPIPRGGVHPRLKLGTNRKDKA
jgi:hypothetical protein